MTLLSGQPSTTHTIDRCPNETGGDPMLRTFVDVNECPKPGVINNILGHSGLCAGMQE